ncbi:unnamed protein product [Protopolystoma xenopodis]|uniref:Uncharacterized protein n=1 Tax=Protopolystoma xenopodis TaxID=117903 RepID=A0A3S5B4Y7_9PLAT|nr:unnamed protein product [Protopolystoma xenopodis]
MVDFLSAQTSYSLTLPGSPFLISNCQDGLDHTDSPELERVRNLVHQQRQESCLQTTATTLDLFIDWLSMLRRRVFLASRQLLRRSIWLDHLFQEIQIQADHLAKAERRAGQLTSRARCASNWLISVLNNINRGCNLTTLDQLSSAISADNPFDR